MSENESECSFEEANGRLSLEIGETNTSDSDTEFTNTVELSSNVADRPKKNKRAPQMKMEEELRAKIEALTLELELAKRSAAANSMVVGNEQMAGARVPDFRELKEYVSTFDPRVPTCLSAEVWVQTIDTTGNVYGWSNATRLHCARMNLGGCAKLWLEGCQRAVHNWESFKAEIVKGFPTRKNRYTITICCRAENGRPVKQWKNMYMR